MYDGGLKRKIKSATDSPNDEEINKQQMAVGMLIFDIHTERVHFYFCQQNKHNNRTFMIKSD